MVISKEWKNTIYSNATEELTLTTLHTFHQPRSPFTKSRLRYIETSRKGEERRYKPLLLEIPVKFGPLLKSCYFLSTKFNFNSKNTFISFFKILWFACFAPIWSVQDKYFAFNLADPFWDTPWDLSVGFVSQMKRKKTKCQICSLCQSLTWVSNMSNVSNM